MPPDAFSRLPAPLRSAIDEMEALVRQQPNHVAALHRLGQLYAQTPFADRAVTRLTQAVHLAPGQPQLHFDLGCAWQRLGRPQEAEQSFAHAAQAAPDFIAAQLKWAQLLQQRGAAAAAIAPCDAVLARQPKHPEALRMRALSALLTRDYAKAEQFVRRACQAAPDNLDNIACLGVVLNMLRRAEEAEPLLRQALARAPESKQFLFSLAENLLLRGVFAEGFTAYAQAIATMGTPQSAAIQMRLAHVPVWQQGEPLAGQRVLVWAEQGMGDAIMFARYLPMLLAAGATTVGVVCAANLARLFSHIAPGIEVLDWQAVQRIEGFDLACPMSSLPARCATPATPIPQPGAYLAAPADAVALWQDKLATVQAKPAAGLAPRLRVGLVWAGNPETPMGPWRDIPLGLLAPLFDCPGVCFVSLQHGAARAQIGKTALKLYDPSDAIGDFLDTAALIAALDLVIAVDTAVAHLAGALGKPVWLLNRFESEWRWQLDRNDSPWYPSMRIFNQRQPGDWKPVVRAVRDALIAHPGQA